MFYFIIAREKLINNFKNNYFRVYIYIKIIVWRYPKKIVILY